MPSLKPSNNQLPTSGWSKKIIFIIVFFLALSTVHFLNLYPNYLGLKKTPENYQYSGQISWLDPWDINVYVTAIINGQEGNFLLKNRYTTIKHQASLIYPFYTLLGMAFPYANPFYLFHISTLFTGSMLFCCLYKISQYFLNLNDDILSNETKTQSQVTKHHYYSLLSAWVASLAGGLGWIFKHQFFPADLNNTSFTFHSAFQRPHEAIGTLFYLLSLFYYFLFIYDGQKQQPPIKKLLVALCFSLLLIVFFPYYLLNTVLVIIFLNYYLYKHHLPLLWKRLWPVVLCFLVVAIFTFIYFIHLRITGFSSVATQKLHSARLLGVILGYGLLLMVSIFNLVKHKQNNLKSIFLISWFGISLLLEFTPFGFAIFYSRALFLNLTIMSFLLIKKVYRNNQQLAKLLLNCLLVLLPLSSLFIFWQRVAEAGNINNYWAYQKNEVWQAIDFLKKQTKQNVLTYYVIGNYLPAHSNKEVVFGHLIQTPNVSLISEQIEQFYANQLSDDQAKNFLTKYNVDYVWLGADERILGLASYPFLKKVYDNSEVRIYEYQHEQQ